MSSLRLSSPARSQGMASPRPRKSRRTRSVCSATSNTSVRLTTVIQDSFRVSPTPDRMSVLNDDTDIQMPGRQSWWKRIGDNSRNVTDIIEERANEVIVKVTNVEEDFGVEILSQDENMSVDLPESSDGESIHSIIIPQRKIFQENHPQKISKKIASNKENLVKMQKSYFDQTNIDQQINVMPKKLFNQGKPKTKPVFTAALLNASANKTVSTSIDKPAPEVQGQVRNLFGNRPGTKRKNAFSAFLLSDSEDDVPDIQPKLFGFPKRKEKQQRRSPSHSSIHSGTSNITDTEMDEWQHLPSSTMVEHQFEAGEITPLKKTRLSQLSKPEQPEVAKNQNSSINDKSKMSNQSKKSNQTNTKETHIEADEINIIDTHSPSINKSKNSSKILVNINKSKSNESNAKIIYTETEEMNTINTRSQTINKSKNNSNLISKNNNSRTNESNIKVIHTDVVTKPEQPEVVKSQNNKSKMLNESYKSNQSKAKEIPTEAEEINVTNNHSQSFNKSKNNSNIIITKNISRKETLVINSSKLVLDVLDDNTLTQENVQVELEGINKKNEKTLTAENQHSDVCGGENFSLVFDDGHEIFDGNVKERHNDQKQNSINQEINLIQRANESNHAVQTLQEYEHENETAQELLQSIQEGNKSEQENEGQNDDEQAEIENRNEVGNESAEDSQSNVNGDVLENDPKHNIMDHESTDSEIIKQMKNVNDEQSTKHTITDVDEKMDLDIVSDSDNEPINTASNRQPNVSHDSTGRFRKDNLGTRSPEAVLNYKNSREESYTARGRNTTINKSKTMIKELSIRPSLVPARESTEITDSSINSSAEGSGWDSHRTTRKTLRQTFGKDFTPRKSLRTLVMERTAKRQTNQDQVSDKSKRQSYYYKVADKSKQDNLNDITSGTIRFPMANSTEYPVSESYHEQDQVEEFQPDSVQDHVEKFKSNKAQEQVEEFVFDIEKEQSKKSKSIGALEQVQEFPLQSVDQESVREVEEFVSNREQEVVEEIESEREQEEGEENESDGDQEVEENESDKEQGEVDVIESGREQEEIEDNESDKEQEELDEIESEREEEEVEETESEREQEKIGEIESDREQKDDDEIDSDREPEGVEEIESEREQEEIGEIESDREQQEIEESESDREQKDFDEMESDREQQEVERFESDTEPEDVGGIESGSKREEKQKSGIEQEEVEELESSREEKESEEFESDKEQEVDYESDKEPLPLEDEQTIDESNIEASRQVNMNTLETYLLKVKQENADMRRKMQEQVMNSLKMARKPYNMFKMPEIPKQSRSTKIIKTAAKTKPKPSPFSSGMLPPEFLEDMKYKPPKRFQGKNASWITKRLYKYLEEKLEPKYDYRARVRAEKLVEKLYHFAKDVRKSRAASPEAIVELKHEMARLGIVKTHYEFYCFFHEFMPREIRIRVNPDILNKLPAPKRVFADIIEDDNNN